VQQAFVERCQRGVSKTDVFDPGENRERVMDGPTPSIKTSRATASAYARAGPPCVGSI
jgi:hypothetical protein